MQPRLRVRVAEPSFTQVFMTRCLIVDVFVFTFCFRRKTAGRLPKSSSSFEANHSVGCQLVTGKARVQSQGSDYCRLSDTGIDFALNTSVFPWKLLFCHFLYSSIYHPCNGQWAQQRHSSRNSLTSSYENTKYKINYILPYRNVPKSILSKYFTAFFHMPLLVLFS